MPDQYALITGANRGIGLELAKQLGTKGYSVIITAREQAALDTAVTLLKAQQIQVQGYLLDVTDVSDTTAF